MFEVSPDALVRTPRRAGFYLPAGWKNVDAGRPGFYFAEVTGHAVTSMHQVLVNSERGD
jgi:hypothetical protein